MKKNHLIMSTLLFCGLGLFSACTDSQDNPTPTPVPEPEPVVETNRIIFENQFSQDMQAMADDFRFDAASQAVTSIREFVSVLDENALAEQTITILSELVKGLSANALDQLTDQDRNALIACLKSRFDLTDQDIEALPGYFVIDAYKSIGKMKLDFNAGKCIFSDDAEGFTVINTSAKGETRTLTLTFNDQSDGVCFFIANLGETVPLAIQLPKSIGISLTTPQGQVVTGTVSLTTIDPTQSQFIEFKKSGWVADAKLSLNVNNRQENISLYIKHSENRALDLKAAFEINGKPMASIEVNDMHDAYTDEELNSETFTSLREMGPFFSAAYDVLKALRGKSVDNVVITLNDNMVIGGKIDDIGKALLALGNTRKLYGTQPGFETIDQYTQQLNQQVHFVISQKNTGIVAAGELVTVIKNQQVGEYQPAVALKFDGETEAQPMLARMNDADLANYKKLTDSLTPLSNALNELVAVAKTKVGAIVEAVKTVFK